MGLGNRTLSSPIMSGSTLSDEQESVRLRYANGARVNSPDLADLYDRTGNMRVARTLAKYQDGGLNILPPETPEPQETGFFAPAPKYAGLQKSIRSANETPTGESWWQENRENIGEGVMDVSTGLLNVAPNIANIKDYRTLPNIPAPALMKSVALEEPNLESTRQALIAQGRSAQQQADIGSSQSGAQQAGRAQALAQTQSSLSRLGGEEARMQMQVRNQNRMANQQSQARNLQSMNQYYQDQTGREMAITRGVAGERAAITNKILGSLGDLRQRELDDRSYRLAKQRLDHTGGLTRWAEGVLTDDKASEEDKAEARRYLRN